MSVPQQPNPGEGVPSGNKSKVPINQGKEEPDKKRNAADDKAKASTPKKTKKRMKIFTWPKLPLKIKEDITLGDIVNTIIAFAAIAALFISITTLKETRKEWEIENRPYLQLTDIIFKKLPPQVQHPFDDSMYFQISDFGKLPGQVFQIQYAPIIRVNGDTAGVDAVPTMTAYNYISVGPGVQDSNKNLIRLIVSGKDQADLRQGNKTYYFRVSLTYMCPINQKRYMCNLIYVFNLIDGVITLVRNVDKEIPSD
jgi:hypothetical protein